MRIVRNLSVQILAIAGLAASAAAQAEDFRVQAQLAYDRIEVDDVDLDADVLTASGTFFFKPVPTDDVPVGEAAFIARSSYASVEASSFDADGAEADAFAANVGYHFTNTIFFARVGVVQTDVFGDDDTSWNGTLGIVPIPRLFFGTDVTEDDYDPNLTARYAGKLANSHWYAASIFSLIPTKAIRMSASNSTTTSKSSSWVVASTRAAMCGTCVPKCVCRTGSRCSARYFTDDFSDGFGVQLTWRDL